MAIVEVINFIFASILVFFHFSMFHAVQKYKNIRSREENLFLGKTLFTIICFTFYIFLCIFLVLEICPNDRSNYFYQVQEYIFNIYLIILYSINLFMSFEMFFTYQNPIHYYLIIFNRKTNKAYNIFTLILCLGVLAVNILDPFGYKKSSLNIKDIEPGSNHKTYYTPFVLLDNWKWVYLLGTNVLALIYNFRLSFLISKFDFEKKDKLKKVIKKKILSNFCYFFYPIYNLLLFGILKEKKGKIDYKVNLFSIIIGSFIIIIILTIDTIIDLFLLSTTKFSQYKLRKTLVGYIGYIFPNDFDEDNFDMLQTIKLPKKNLSNSDDEDEDEEDENEEGEGSENEAEISLIPKCKKDTELVSIFKNNIFFEDYFMSFCDQYLNILTASLFKMYNSKLFSIKSVENKKIKEEMGGISISGIGGVGNASNTQEMSASAHEGENSTTFIFYKKKGKNHFTIFKQIFGQTTEDIKVKITSYYTDNCVMNIKKLNLASKKIASSLVSHFIIAAKKEDNDNPNNFWSLTSANAKEEYFKNQKNLSFKSYDKNFTFDFFETDDDNISVKNKSTKNIALLIKRYFDYIQNGKGKTGTFLPELIGIFKIKINDFKTMLLYVSRNSIVNNVPRNFYTYWQLLRFDKIKPEKVATSKYHRGALVTEDSLFERLYASDIKKNKDVNKIMLKNYLDFKEIIGNDINFLKENNIYANLLMMYFEYENTQKHEKEGAIKIRKTDANEAEIINIDMPEPEDQKKENEEFEKKENETTSKKDENKENEKKEIKENSDEILKINADDEINNDQLNAKISDELYGEKGQNDDLFGDEGFDFMPDLGKEAHNLLDYTEKVNITGYEGNFDNFICMCFFIFENAFDLNNKSGSNPDEVFKNKILENFSEFKSKE